MKDEIYHLVKLALAYGRVERGVSHPDGEPESDTDHSVSLAWLACSLARKLYPHLDQGLIAQFAIVHDAPEIYAGDTYAVTAGEEGRKMQKEKEAAALRRIWDEMDELDWLPRMIDRYEDQSDPEARFVWAIDKMMPKIVLRIEGKPGERLRVNGVTAESIREFRLREQAEFEKRVSDFPEILQLREELHALLAGDDEMIV